MTGPVDGLPRVVVVGLGPAGADLLPAAAVAAIDAVPVRFLRTERHPAADAVPDATTFDEVYEAAARLDDVYPEIVERLVAAAVERGEVLYAVPGSPVVAERTVELLVADERVAVELVPAMSFLDLAWVRLGVDPVALGVRIVDGHRFEVDAAGQRGPLLVAQCDSPMVLSDVKLAIGDAIDRAADLGGGLARRDLAGTGGETIEVVAADGGPADDGPGIDGAGAGGPGEAGPGVAGAGTGGPSNGGAGNVGPGAGGPGNGGAGSAGPGVDGAGGVGWVAGDGWVPDDIEVTVVARLGLPDESITTVAWHELDRVPADHLTSVWVPRLAAPIAGEVQRFAELVATLRAECPWDREQTHESLRRHLLEEAYEVLEAIDGVDPDTGEGYDHLEEELGDLLFQVLFHATLAAEAGQFTLADVATTVHDKLRARHPHVFGDVEAGSAEQVAADWEQAKKAEKGRDSVFDGIPEALPSLLYALKVQKKAASLAGGALAVARPALDDDAGDGDGGGAVGGRAGVVGGGPAGVVGGAVGGRGGGGGRGAVARAEMPAVPDLDDAVDRATDTPSPENLGDLLLAVVDLARRAGVDPETTLRSAAVAWRDQARAAEQQSARPAAPEP